MCCSAFYSRISTDFWIHLYSHFFKRILISWRKNVLNVKNVIFFKDNMGALSSWLKAQLQKDWGRGRPPSLIQERVFTFFLKDVFTVDPNPRKYRYWLTPPPTNKKLSCCVFFFVQYLHLHIVIFPSKYCLFCFLSW